MDTNTENIGGGSFCGYKDPSNLGHRRKTDWLKECYAEGLRFKVLRSREFGDIGMIEYAPGNQSWRPVEADGSKVRGGDCGDFQSPGAGTESGSNQQRQSLKATPNTLWRVQYPLRREADRGPSRERTEILEYYEQDCRTSQESGRLVAAVHRPHNAVRPSMGTMIETMTMRLSTKRLELIAATLDLVCAELETPERLASLLRARVEPGWPPGEYDRDAQLFFRDRLTEGGAGVIGWYCWYALRHGSDQRPPVLVGAGGYFGPPREDGVVEIGFSILPAWQNFGYATELTEGLIKNAFADPRVQKVIAHTAPLNLASRRVLEKCGFSFVCLDKKSGNILYAIAPNVGP